MELSCISQNKPRFCCNIMKTSLRVNFDVLKCFLRTCVSITSERAMVGTGVFRHFQLWHVHAKFHVNTVSIGEHNYIL
jgi:hypothetical protein